MAKRLQLTDASVRDEGSLAVCAAGLAVNRMRSLTLARQRSRSRTSTSPSPAAHTSHASVSGSVSGSISSVRRGTMDQARVFSSLDMLVKHGRVGPVPSPVLTRTSTPVTTRNTASLLNAGSMNSATKYSGSVGGAGMAPMRGRDARNVQIVPLRMTTQPLADVNARMESLGAKSITTITALEHMTLVYKLPIAQAVELVYSDAGSAETPRTSTEYTTPTHNSLNNTSGLLHWSDGRQSMLVSSKEDLQVSYRKLSAQRRVADLLERVVQAEAGSSKPDVPELKPLYPSTNTNTSANMNAATNPARTEIGLDFAPTRLTDWPSFQRGSTPQSSAYASNTSAAPPEPTAAHPIPAEPTYVHKKPADLFAAPDEPKYRGYFVDDGIQWHAIVKRDESLKHSAPASLRSMSSPPGRRDSATSVAYSITKSVQPRARSITPDRSSRSLHDFLKAKSPVREQRDIVAATEGKVLQQLLHDPGLLSPDRVRKNAVGTQTDVMRAFTATAGDGPSPSTQTAADDQPSSGKHSELSQVQHGSTGNSPTALQTSAEELIAEVRKQLLRRGLSRSMLQAAGAELPASRTSPRNATSPRSHPSKQGGKNEYSLSARDVLARAREGLQLSYVKNGIGYAPASAPTSPHQDDAAEGLARPDSVDSHGMLDDLDLEKLSSISADLDAVIGTQESPERGTEPGTKGLSGTQHAGLGPRPVVIARTLSSKSFNPAVPPPPLPGTPARVSVDEDSRPAVLDVSPKPTDKRSALSSIPSAQRIWLRAENEGHGPDTEAQGSGRHEGEEAYSQPLPLQPLHHVGEDALMEAQPLSQSQSFVVQPMVPMESELFMAPNVSLVISPFASADAQLASLEIGVAELERRRKERLLLSAASAGRQAGQAAALAVPGLLLDHSFESSSITVEDLEASRLVARKLAEAADAAAAYRRALEEAMHTDATRLNKTVSITDQSIFNALDRTEMSNAGARSMSPVGRADSPTNLVQRTSHTRGRATSPRRSPIRSGQRSLSAPSLPRPNSEFSSHAVAFMRTLQRDDESPQRKASPRAASPTRGGPQCCAEGASTRDALPSPSNVEHQASPPKVHRELNQLESLPHMSSDDVIVLPDDMDSLRHSDPAVPDILGPLSSAEWDSLLATHREETGFGNEECAPHNGSIDHSEQLQSSLLSEPPGTSAGLNDVPAYDDRTLTPKMSVRIDTAAVKHLLGIYSPSAHRSPHFGSIFSETGAGAMPSAAEWADFVDVVDSSGQVGTAQFPVGLLLWSVFQHFTTSGDPLGSYTMSLSKFRRLMREMGLVIDSGNGDIIDDGYCPDVIDIATATRSQILDPGLLAFERRKLCSLESYELLFVAAATRGEQDPEAMLGVPLAAFEGHRRSREAAASADIAVTKLNRTAPRTLRGPAAIMPNTYMVDLAASTRRSSRDPWTASRPITPARKSAATAARGAATEIVVNLKSRFDASSPLHSRSSDPADLSIRFGGASAGHRLYVDFGQFLTVLNVIVSRRFGRVSSSAWNVFTRYCLLPLAESLGRNLLRAGAGHSMNSTISPALRKEQVAEHAADCEMKKLLDMNKALLTQLFGHFCRQPGLGRAFSKMFAVQNAQRTRASSRSRQRGTVAAPATAGNTSSGLMDISQLAAFAHAFGLLGVICDFSQLQRAFSAMAGSPKGDGEPTSASEFIDLLDFDNFQLVLVYLAVSSHYTAARSPSSFSNRLAALLERMEVSGGRTKLGTTSRGALASNLRFRW